MWGIICFSHIWCLPGYVFPIFFYCEIICFSLTVWNLCFKSLLHPAVLFRLVTWRLSPEVWCGCQWLPGCRKKRRNLLQISADDNLSILSWNHLSTWATSCDDTWATRWPGPLLVVKHPAKWIKQWFDVESWNGSFCMQHLCPRKRLY